MKKYIEAEKFKESIKELTSCMFSYEMTTGEIEDDFFELVDDEPAADVQEVKHGYWQNKYRSGTTVEEGVVSSCCDMWNNRKSQFCPNCGARMDGEGR